MCTGSHVNVYLLGVLGAPFRGVGSWSACHCWTVELCLFGSLHEEEGPGMWPNHQLQGTWVHLDISLSTRYSGRQMELSGVTLQPLTALREGGY